MKVTKIRPKNEHVWFMWITGPVWVLIRSTDESLEAFGTLAAHFHTFPLFLWKIKLSLFLLFLYSFLSAGSLVLAGILWSSSGRCHQNPRSISTHSFWVYEKERHTLTSTSRHRSPLVQTLLWTLVLFKACSPLYPASDSYSSSVINKQFMQPNVSTYFRIIYSIVQAQLYYGNRVGLAYRTKWLIDWQSRVRSKEVPWSL